MNNGWLSCYLALVSRTYKPKRPPGCFEEMQNNRCGPGLCRAGMCCLDDEVCWHGQAFLKYRCVTFVHNIKNVA